MVQTFVMIQTLELRKVTGKVAVDSRVPTEGRAGSQGGQVLWPVRSGPVPPLADGFITRSETAPDLRTALVPGATVALVPDRVTAKGSRDWLGSCGKTQLAVGFAESLWQSRGLELLVWVTATSRARVLSGYVQAAEATMGTDHSGSAESGAGRFLSWLAETSRPWLVVLDDLSDAADLDGLWPEGPAGRVLITTSNSAALSDGHQALMRPVGPFSRREALSYLMGRLTADTGQRIGAIDLVEDLGGEPLALAQASAVIVNSALSCHEYRGHFARRREQLAQAAHGEPAAGAVTWTFSFEQADRLWPGGDGQSLLALAALLDGHGIPGEVFTTSAAGGFLAESGAGGRPDRERARAEAALLIVERAGLLAVDHAATPPTVRMSRVVQTAVRATMSDWTLDHAARAAADALLEVWHDKEDRTALAGALRSSAASLGRAAADLLWAGGCHPMLLRAGSSLDGARLTGPAVAYWRELATVSGQVLGQNHPDTLVIANQLADAYLTAGRPAEAIPWCQWVLATRARALGPDDPRAIAARHNLGRALVAANQLRDAITVLEGAVGDYERVRGADHLDTLDSRDELAAAYHAADQFDVVIPLCQRTLADRERIQGPRHPDTTTTREKLAAAYLADGRIKEAIPHYKRALADRDRVLGTDHPDTIAARGNLGSAYHSAGRMASALRLYEQACEGYGRVLGTDHPDTLARRANLAHAYYAAGRLTDATTLLRDTAARCERVLPPGDPLRQTVRDSLTNIAGA
jgi:tetratricopeptide (TPR) repeat protein